MLNGLQKGKVKGMFWRIFVKLFSKVLFNEILQLILPFLTECFEKYNDGHDKVCKTVKFSNLTKTWFIFHKQNGKRIQTSLFQCFSLIVNISHRMFVLD
jgi:hypothetical protein